MSASLARPEIAALQPYLAAVQEPGALRLNANEAACSSSGNGLNRYPPIRPDALHAALAHLFAVDESKLLVTRGSSEAIDLLIRTFCRAYEDNIVITPPSFSMYPVYARMQGAAIVKAPLNPTAGWCLDTSAVLGACTANSKLLFVCSPNNPTGNSVPLADIETLLSERAARSLIVVDEAYIEYSERQSLIGALDRHQNLVVLRTLSKAWGLAGTRCGAVAAAPDVIELLARMLPPYAFSSPTTAAVLDALSDTALQRARDQIAKTIGERRRLADELAALACVAHVWPSDSNFLLVRFDDLAAVQARLDHYGILVRAFDDGATLSNCARITIGSVEENDRLLMALAARREKC